MQHTPVGRPHPRLVLRHDVRLLVAQHLQPVLQPAQEAVIRAALDRVSCFWLFDKGGALQAVHQALKYGNRPTYGVTLGEDR